jgi:hypothetical protein
VSVPYIVIFFNHRYPRLTMQDRRIRVDFEFLDSFPFLKVCLVEF